jgi:Fe-S cluster assembly iron-binding protein IscA
MLTVTEIAKEKLRERLQTTTTKPDTAIRLVASPSKKSRFSLVLDKEEKGDRVVESKAGIKLLLISSDLASELEGFVVDFQESPTGAGFTISGSASG